LRCLAGSLLFPVDRKLLIRQGHSLCLLALQKLTLQVGVLLVLLVILAMRVTRARLVILVTPATPVAVVVAAVGVAGRCTIITANQ
jgi:hypothetical protein